MRAADPTASGGQSPKVSHSWPQAPAWEPGPRGQVEIRTTHGLVIKSRAGLPHKWGDKLGDSVCLVPLWSGWMNPNREVPPQLLCLLCVPTASCGSTSMRGVPLPLWVPRPQAGGPDRSWRLSLCLNLHVQSNFQFHNVTGGERVSKVSGKDSF